MTVEIPRDRWGKPLIIPPGGGKPIPYMRASSFGDVLEDRSNLERWKQKKVAQGLAKNPALLLRAALLADDDRSGWRQLIDDAMEAAGSGNAASVGTSLHALTEIFDRGEALPAYPAEYEADIAAYAETISRFTAEHIEQFVVCDELQIAGTPDRYLREYATGVSHPVGLRVADLKTGGSDARYLDKHCAQLAIYAHSKLYDPATGERTSITVNQKTGLIIHLPAGQGVCTLYNIDLVAGWEAVQKAHDVRQWRKRKNILTPYTTDNTLELESA